MYQGSSLEVQGQSISDTVRICHFNQSSMKNHQPPDTFKTPLDVDSSSSSWIFESLVPVLKVIMDVLVSVQSLRVS